MSPQAASPTSLYLAAAPAERGRGGVFYHPELDALRFFAFLLVFAHHALPGDVALYVNSGVPEGAARWLLTAKGAGAYGVDLFFTLSAYLITELLVREHLSRGRLTSAPSTSGGRCASGPFTSPSWPPPSHSSRASSRPTLGAAEVGVLSSASRA